MVTNDLIPTSGTLGTLFPSFVNAINYSRSLASPLVARVTQLLARPLGRQSVTGEGGTGLPIDPRNTLMGTPLTSSRSTSAYKQVQEVYARRDVIIDVKTLMLTDSRFRRAVWTRAHRSVAGGFEFRARARKGTSALTVKRVQDGVDAMLRRTGILDPDGKPNLALLAAWDVEAITTGDLFLQRVVAFHQDGEMTGDVVAVKMMPSESMQRLTDDADQFTDPSRAFIAMDIYTNREDAAFALWQIDHHRWNHTLGRYGESDFIASRAPVRKLSVMEQSQEVRRMSRSSQKRLHTFGTADKPSSPEDLQAYEDSVGNGEHVAEIAADPYDQLTDYFSNGLLSIQTLEGDPNIDQIEDLNYFADKVDIATGTPRQVLGGGLTGIGRDTLDFVLEEWLIRLQPEGAMVARALYETIKLQLRLMQVNPDSLLLSLSPRKQTLETATDRANFLKTLSQNTSGAGLSAKPMPLATRRRMVSVIADDLGIDDIDAELEELDAEMEDNHIDPDTVQKQQEMSQTSQGGAQVGSANSKNAPGGATAGYGKRFEGGKPKQSSDRAPGEGYKA